MRSCKSDLICVMLGVWSDSNETKPLCILKTDVVIRRLCGRLRDLGWIYVRTYKNILFDIETLRSDFYSLCVGAGIP